MRLYQSVCFRCFLANTLKLILHTNCSVQEVFGDKLVKPLVLDSDFGEDLFLPSPNQLKYKILIKNKKLQPSQSSKQRVFLLFMVFLVRLVSYPFKGLQCFDAVGWTAGRPSGLQEGLNCQNKFTSGAGCFLGFDSWGCRTQGGGQACVGLECLTEGRFEWLV